VASNVTSSLVDSAVFLTLAVGGTPALNVIAGMTVDKLVSTIVMLALIAPGRARAGEVPVTDSGGLSRRRSTTTCCAVRVSSRSTRAATSWLAGTM
jgi:hypothetical protein